MRQGVGFALILAASLVTAVAQSAPRAKAKNECSALFEVAGPTKPGAILKLGSLVRVELAPGESDPYLFDLIVIGRYGDRVALVNPDNSFDIHFMTPAYLEAHGYKTNLRNFPRMTPQTGPTCLPFAIAYLQNITGDSKRLAVIPDFFRAGFMSLSMTFNPMMQLSDKVQLANAESAMRASGIKYDRTKKLEDVTAHLEQGGIALVGLFVGGGEGSYSDIPLQNATRMKVATPRGRVQGAHAMVAIGVVNVVEEGFATKLYILLDPMSGQITAARSWDMKSEHIESFLIHEPSSP